MILTLTIPDRCMFNALYFHRGGWAASVRADDSWKTPYGSSHYGLSGSSVDHADPQAAIDAAYEKMTSFIAKLDAEPQQSLPKFETKPIDAKAIAGLDLGGLDL